MPESLGHEAPEAQEPAPHQNRRAPPTQRPLQEGQVDTGKRYPVTVKAQVLTFYSVGLSTAQIHHRLDITERTIRQIRSTAQQRGWEEKSTDPIGSRILLSYVEAQKSPGRPKNVKEDIRKLDELTTHNTLNSWEEVVDDDS